MNEDEINDLYTVDLSIHGITEGNVEEILEFVKRKFQMFVMTEMSITEYVRSID